MSNDGKHHFHLKEYSILQNLIVYIKVSELNTPSDGNGITGIPFLNEMGIKKKKTFTQIVAVGRFLILQKMSNDCKSNVSAHTGILQHWEVFYILF